eukprot:CAMPEP_0202916202 /NCGR_PEP_ID=MMETSP1392-20130828/67953_1 /ASSEMBLY_ACC=CAM_ASM_000868 /TAXON_ID=225041 /ORGANISM="Chlamydomonas chlamydogama, Strain SAG 11-48b" /LENGTH=425 /DNA_ID=CAMNT_0049608539 /DNA_START=77 /DNA_END=1351 /DNA_ORIENTATION=-
MRKCGLFTAARALAMVVAFVAVVAPQHNAYAEQPRTLHRDQLQRSRDATFGIQKVVSNAFDLVENNALPDLQILSELLNNAVASPAAGAQEVEVGNQAASDILRVSLALLSDASASPQAYDSWLQVVSKNISTLLQAQDQRPTSFPLVRRTVMAVLLSWHARGQPPGGRSTTTSATRQPNSKITSGTAFSAVQTTAILQLSLSMYRLHVRGMAARGLLEHIHVSKAAGSTICQLAKLNLCSTKVFEPRAGRGNCLISELEDLPHWVSLQAHLALGFPDQPRLPYVRYGHRRSRQYSCAERQALLQSSGWDFYGNEYTLLTVRAGLGTALSSQAGKNSTSGAGSGASAAAGSKEAVSEGKLDSSSSVENIGEGSDAASQSSDHALQAEGVGGQRSGGGEASAAASGVTRPPGTSGAFEFIAESATR